ncbi:hypothetical protein MTO96_048382 [Rhipicephalus appendiculatus]
MAFESAANSTLVGFSYRSLHKLSARRRISQVRGRLASRRLPSTDSLRARQVVPLRLRVFAFFPRLHGLRSPAGTFSCPSLSLTARQCHVLRSCFVP